jgi:uncharacterized protein (TIGR02266 family)
MSADRRKGEREALTLKVEYDDAAGLVHDFTENISHGGTFVLTTRQLEVGTPVSLVLSFPGLLQPLTLGGVVRWQRSSPPEEQGVGVEFSDLSDENRARLEQVVAAIEHGDPSLVAQRLRVLVVEDNPHVATLIREGLAGGGRREFDGRLVFDFEHVRDGREATAALARDPFDVLIIDVYLPVMDGPSVIKDVRSRERDHRMPIVAMSAGGPAARAAALAAGADFFLEKPMRLADIVNTMRKLAGK